jgi:hypothetical protein
MDDKDVVTLVLFVFLCFSLGKKRKRKSCGKSKIPKLFLLLLLLLLRLFGSVCYLSEAIISGAPSVEKHTAVCCVCV